MTPLAPGADGADDTGSPGWPELIDPQLPARFGTAEGRLPALGAHRPPPAKAVAAGVRAELAARLLDPWQVQPWLLRLQRSCGTTTSGLTPVRGWELHQARARISRRVEGEGAAHITVVWSPVATEGRASGPEGWWAVTGYTQGRSRAAMARPGAASTLHHAPSLDAVAWRLMDDPAMPNLRALLGGWARPDPAAADAAADADSEDDPSPAPAWPRSGPGDLPRAEIRRYEPASHVVMRLLPRAQPNAAAASTHAPAREPVWVKAYADDRAVRVHAIARRWHRLAAADPLALQVPEPLGLSRGWRAVWQREAAGPGLAERLAGSESAALMQQLAEGLVRLQQWPLWPEAGAEVQGVPPAPALDAAGLIHRGLKQARKLGQAAPELAPLLALVMERLGDWHAALAGPGRADARRVLVHGDCHPDQFAIVGGRLVVYDLDNCSLGSPAHDVADFGSQLLTDERWTAPVREALARRWWQISALALGPGLDPLDLARHRLVLLLRKAYSQFVRHQKGWSRRSAEALRLALLAGPPATTPALLEAIDGPR